MKIAIVLNYNNYENSISCTNKLIESGVDRVIIVDNASKNNSYEKLQQEFNKKNEVRIIRSSTNNGYASGNNIGLKFAEKMYGLNNIVYVVNPDVLVNSDVINNVASVIKEILNAGMVTTEVNNSMNSAWRHTGLLRGFIFNLWVVNIILYKFGIIERKGYKKSSNNIQKVEVVSGAFFGIDQKAFKIVGYFDDQTFLYYEEEILCCKLKKNKFENYIVNNVSYSHAEQSSTNIPKLQSKIINDKSRLYFLTQYDNANAIYILLYKMINIVDNQIFKLFFRLKKYDV